MSAPEDNIRVAAAAAAAAAEWLALRDRGPWSDANQAELDAWLNQSFAHATAFWRLDAAWERAGRLGALKRPSGQRLLHAQRLLHTVSGRFPAVLLRMAAAALVLSVLGTAAYFTLPSGERSYETTVGGHETLTLGDGTRIELNTDTKVRVARDRRKVWLERGEAYFDVVHNPAHPFVVLTGDHRVTDLGTKFLVRQNGARLEVSLFEGKAQLDSTGRWAKPRSATLVPGDVAVATATSMSVARKPQKALAGELGWRRGVLVFHHTTLAEAAAEFNRYNHRKLVVEDPAAARLTIDGTFQADNIEDFTRLAQLVLGVRVENRGREIALMH